MTAVQLCRLSRFAAVTIIASLFIAWSAPLPAVADDSILTNPDLTEGTDNDPNGWVQAEHLEGVSTFNWVLQGQNPPELDVSSPQANDAFWAQELHLDPGWYFFSASVRSENVPEGLSGAALSLVDLGIGSPDLHGTSDWQTVGFYVKVGECGADGRLGCRLGGFASMNTGLAACSNIVGETVDFPAPDGNPIFDLDQLGYVDPLSDCASKPGS